MRKAIFIATAALLGVTSLAFGSNKVENASEETAIVSVARNYMNAYYTGDAVRMERALHPDFHKRTLRTAGDAKVREIKEDNVQSMLEGVRSGSGTKIPENERVQKIQVLDIYRDAATVKVTTGRWIDYMLITRQNGEWRVLDVILQYTKK